MDVVKLPCYCATLRQATRTITAFYDGYLREAGLRVTQFTLLQALDYRPGLRIRDLEEVLAMDQTTLSRNLALLEKEDWVRVIDRPTAREKCWGLTAEGARVLARALPRWHAAQQEVDRRLGEGRTGRLHADAYAVAARLA
jgi:DNA-binding MarR family transcriptional regulator